MLEFAERIKPYGVKWIVQFRVDDVKPDVLKKMISAGLMTLYFGIESMSDPVLTSMKKHTSKAQIIHALETARNARVLCSGNIILGDPEETIETARESINWWKRNPVYNVVLAFILAVPDSPVYRYAVENGLNHP